MLVLCPLFPRFYFLIFLLIQLRLASAQPFSQKASFRNSSSFLKLVLYMVEMPQPYIALFNHKMHHNVFSSSSDGSAMQAVIFTLPSDDKYVPHPSLLNNNKYPWRVVKTRWIPKHTKGKLDQHNLHNPYVHHPGTSPYARKNN